MASLGKIAAVVAIVRLFVVAFPTRADDWRPAVFVLAVLTLVIGSVLAIVQTDVKRMLAYSSVSHAAFMLVGLEAAGHLGSPAASDGVSSALVYVALYSVLVVGSFAAVSVVSRGTLTPMVLPVPAHRSTHSAASPKPTPFLPSASPCCSSRRPACRSPAGS